MVVLMVDGSAEKMVDLLVGLMVEHWVDQTADQWVVWKAQMSVAHLGLKMVGQSVGSWVDHLVQKKVHCWVDQMVVQLVDQSVAQ